MAKTTAVYKVRGALTELTLARIRELTREPEALFWVFVFPILLTAILALAFRSRPPEALPVACFFLSGCRSCCCVWRPQPVIFILMWARIRL